MRLLKPVVTTSVKNRYQPHSRSDHFRTFNTASVKRLYLLCTTEFLRPFRRFVCGLLKIPDVSVRVLLRFKLPVGVILEKRLVNTHIDSIVSAEDIL